MLGNIANEKARLKARLAELEAAEKAARERQEAIAGRVILAVADTDPDFGAKIRELLDQHLTRKRDRAMFDLPDKSATSAPNVSAEGAASSQADAAGYSGFGTPPRA